MPLLAVLLALGSSSVLSQPAVINFISQNPPHVPSGLNLNALRPAGPPPTIVQQTPIPSDFLPLCGNGVLNSANDYQVYYSMHAVLPLVISSQAIGVTGTNTMVKIQLYANEVCDDGNNLDYDGCSADCMHNDLWTNACPLQFDNPAIGAIEAILYTPGGVLLSAAGGLYSINSQLGAADTSLRTNLLRPKGFPVTDMFYVDGLALLYSAPTQYVWQWTGSALLPYHNLSNSLVPWTSHAFLVHDTLAMSDNASVLIFNVTSNQTRTCKAPQVPLQPGCFFANWNAANASLTLVCTSTRLTITIGSNFVSCANALPVQPKQSIWTDAFQTSSNLFLSAVQYSMVVNANISAKLITPPYYYEVYSPMGTWAEVPLDSPRTWLSSSSMDAPFVGDPTVYSAAVASSVSCGASTRCAFDVNPLYDLFGPVSTNALTWQNILQYVVANVTNGTSVSTFAALYQNASLYGQVLSQFASIFAQTTVPKIAFSYMIQPQTNNLWVVRNNGLYEISKSGVQIQIANSGGMCMPSGLALCAPCQWAAAGGTCQPCSSVNTSSRAWALLCAGCTTGLGRRLLQQATTTTLEFVVSGNYTLMSAALASTVSACGVAVWAPLASVTNWDVKMQTSNPVACMRALKPVLNTLQVLVAPHTSITVTPPVSPVPIFSSDDTDVTVGITVFVLVVLLLIIGFCWTTYSARKTFKQAMRGDQSSNFSGAQYTSIPRINPQDVRRK